MSCFACDLVNAGNEPVTAKEIPFKQSYASFVIDTL